MPCLLTKLKLILNLSIKVKVVSLVFFVHVSMNLVIDTNVTSQQVFKVIMSECFLVWHKMIPNLEEFLHISLPFGIWSGIPKLGKIWLSLPKKIMALLCPQSNPQRFSFLEVLEECCQMIMNGNPLQESPNPHISYLIPIHTYENYMSKHKISKLDLNDLEFLDCCSHMIVRGPLCQTKRWLWIFTTLRMGALNCW